MSIRRRLSIGARRAGTRAVETLFGAGYRDHRVPLGPIAGSRLHTRPALSLRMYLGLAEPHVCRTVRQVLRPGDTVYDVGAHIGYLTVLFARLVGTDGRVEAFELLPGTAALLQRTIDANGLSQCTVHAVGLSDEERENRTLVNEEAMGTAEYHAGPDVEGPVELCRVTRLDDYREERALSAPTLLKIDVEGAEARTLRGAAGTIRDAGPLLLVELHRPRFAEECLAWMSEVGYTARTVEGAPVTANDLTGIRRYPANVLAWRETPEHLARVAGGRSDD